MWLSHSCDMWRWLIWLKDIKLKLNHRHTLNLHVCEERPPFCMPKTWSVSVVLSCLSNDDDADIEQLTVWIPLNIYYFAIYLQIERLEKQHRSQQVLIQIYGLFVWLFFSKVFFIMSMWKSSFYAVYGCKKALLNLSKLSLLLLCGSEALKRWFVFTWVLIF